MPENDAAKGLLRFVPGAAGHPREVVRRRLVIGLLVVLVTTLLQAMPLVQRGASLDALALRLVFTSVEMIAVMIAASLVYRLAHERRARTSSMLLATLSASALTAAFLLVPFALVVQRFSSLRASGDPRITVAQGLVFGLLLGLLYCGVWALAFVFPYFADDARLRAVESDRLRVEAEQLKSAAELARLRSQLEPHFLLNTLNAVAGLVTENPREARRLLVCLGDLLRDSLHDGDELQPLENEIAWLRRYAEILESRHAGHLEFRWEIDGAAAGVLVPRLLLQPLVENAVKHGALRRREGGRVTVRAHVAGEDGSRRVVCAVEDNGPGMDGGAPRAGAFGLRSVRRRLELRFPDGRLDIESSELGTRSLVDMPCGDPSS